MNCIRRIAQRALVVFTAAMTSMGFAAQKTRDAEAVWQEAKDAYSKQDYARAFRLTQPLAEQGDAEAQCSLGKMYEDGQGVAQDSGKAREWYEKAAAQGLAMAQYNLGALYIKGQGVAQDYGKARTWFEKAAAQGDAGAQNNLGGLYHNGQGVAQDHGKAREWYEKAAARGLAIAQNNLGVLYENGQGVKPPKPAWRKDFRASTCKCSIYKGFRAALLGETQRSNIVKIPLSPYIHAMAYSIDLRQKALEKLAQGTSVRKVAEHFGIHFTTVQTWKTQPVPKKYVCSPRKISRDALLADVKEHPTDYLRERALRFNCTPDGIRKAMLRYHISRKKRS